MINSSRILWQRLRIFLHAIQNISLIHGKTILFQADEQGHERGDAIDLPFKYLAGMAFPQPSAFFRRDAYENTGLLNPSLHYGMDYDFFAQNVLAQRLFTGKRTLFQSTGFTIKASQLLLRRNLQRSGLMYLAEYYDHVRTPII